MEHYQYQQSSSSSQPPNQPQPQTLATSPQAEKQLQIVHLPIYFHLCDTQFIIGLVVEMLNRLVTHNDIIPLSTAHLTRFHSRTPPGITIFDYIKRIVKYASIEKCTLILMLIYIDRICEVHKTFTISSLTIHRFMITALTVASKSISDIYCTNTHFGKVGGISLQELNMLELEFCNMISWNLSCSVEMLQQYYYNLVRTSRYFDFAPLDQQPSSVVNQ